MNFKKKVSGSWTDTPHYIHNTSTDTITTLPAVIHPTGTTATVGLKGNTLQSSIPSPTSPIMPQGTGERTGNLANMYGIDATGLNLTFKTDSNMTVKINGTKQDGVNIRDLVHPNIMLPAGKYTLKIKMIGGSITNITGGVMFGINKSNYSMRTAPQVNTVGQVGTRTFTLNSDTLLTSLDITPSYSDVGAIFNDAVFQCWLYSGNGNVPYEPYGIKIPISSANTTTPVYLGEVQTTRKVKKLVLTGEETLWNESASGIHRLTLDGYMRENTNIPLCTHYIGITPVSAAGDVGNLRIAFLISASGNNYMYIRDTSYTSIADFKTYLQQQYAAGTPVCVWYVLAKPTTGIVNEPIRKIGDYADEVSGITIPTITGGDTIDIDTTLKPSEVTVNYHGWHPVQSVHEKSYNLCPSTGWKSGQYRDGVWEETNTRSTSDMFPVTSSQYRLKINAGQLISFINFNYFDSQKQWLGNRTTLGISTFSPTEQNIVIPQLPSNVTYMSITIRFYNDNGNPPIPQSYIDNSNVMVTEGTSEPAYEPYWK